MLVHTESSAHVKNQRFSNHCSKLLSNVKVSDILTYGIIEWHSCLWSPFWISACTEYKLEKDIYSMVHLIDAIYIHGIPTKT